MNKIRWIFILFIFFVQVVYLNGLDLASMSWKEFNEKTDIIAKVRIVKAEIINHTQHFTFEVEELFKGHLTGRITIALNLMMDGKMSYLGDSGIIALKKVDNSFSFAADGRSFWPVQYIITLNILRIMRKIFGNYQNVGRRVNGVSRRIVTWIAY